MDLNDLKLLDEYNKEICGELARTCPLTIKALIDSHRRVCANFRALRKDNWLLPHECPEGFLRLEDLSGMTIQEIMDLYSGKQ